MSVGKTIDGTSKGSKSFDEASKGEESFDGTSVANTVDGTSEGSNVHRQWNESEGQTSEPWWSTGGDDKGCQKWSYYEEGRVNYVDPQRAQSFIDAWIPKEADAENLRDEANTYGRRQMMAEHTSGSRRTPKKPVTRLN